MEPKQHIGARNHARLDPHNIGPVNIGLKVNARSKIYWSRTCKKISLH